MSNEDKLHYEQVMAERQARVDLLKKHSCLCPATHGEVLRSCPNMLEEESICDTCVLECGECTHPNLKLINGEESNKLVCSDCGFRKEVNG